MLREDGPPRRAQDWSNCGPDIAALVQCTVDVLSSEVDDAGGPEPAANAFYGVLNICRVLQLRHEDTRRVHSKDEAARWVITAPSDRSARRGLAGLGRLPIGGRGDSAADGRNRLADGWVHVLS